MANLSVSGAVSNIDTAALINSLVQAQSSQQTLLKTQQKTQQTASETLTRISTGLSSAGSLAGALAKTATWVGGSATSSSSSVTATATGTSSGSLTFDVTRLAAAHALVSIDAVGSTSATVASGGVVTLTAPDGSTSDIGVGSGTLAEVVSGINAAGKGVVAAAVQTSPGQYRLQLTATRTGAASEFSLAGIDGFTALDVLTQGVDATVRVGSNPATAYDITSSTNTFSELVPGLSFTVGKVESGVTVGAKVDGSAVAAQVSKLVDAVNSVLSQIKTATTYNAATKTGGPLLGDATVRAVQQQLLDTVSGAAAAGVRVTRDGTVSFDQAAFLSAFAADPAKVKSAFGAGATFAPAVDVTGTVALSSSTKATQPGTYAVEVTQRGAREQWVLPGAFYGEGSVLQLARGTTTISYTLKPGEGAVEAAAGLARQAADAGFGVGVTADVDGSLYVTADTAGAAAAFVADIDGLGVGGQVTIGTDTAGTIDGQAATGAGDVLSLPAGTGGAVGLALDTSGITDDDIALTAGAVGSVTFTPGLASKLERLADQFTASTSGTLSTAVQGRQSSVKSLQEQIDAWDRRLAAYRALLSRQFTAMETAIAALKSQTSAITSLVAASSSASSSSSN